MHGDIVETRWLRLVVEGCPSTHAMWLAAGKTSKSTVLALQWMRNTCSTTSQSPFLPRILTSGLLNMEAHSASHSHGCWFRGSDLSLFFKKIMLKCLPCKTHLLVFHLLNKMYPYLSKMELTNSVVPFCNLFPWTIWMMYSQAKQCLFFNVRHHLHISSQIHCFLSWLFVIAVLTIDGKSS